MSDHPPYFADTARASALTAALESWRGTPFVQGHAKRGVGVDCVHLVREVYRAAGVDVSPAERIPAYHLQAGRLDTHSALLAWFRHDADVRQALRPIFADTPPIIGDLWAVRSARSAHHLGVVASRPVCGGRTEWVFWHAPLEGTVCTVPLEQIAACARVAARWRYYPDL
jgi:cell wall-associated NlpC family hydrolase